MMFPDQVGIGMGFKLSAGGGFLVSNVQPGGTPSQLNYKPCTLNHEP